LIPKGVENEYLLKKCMQIFRAALFKSTKTWNPQKCPSVGK
jgi:hypothetical protein